MREYATDLNQRVVKFGRPENSVKLIYGIQTVVGSTREEAEAKYEALRQATKGNDERYVV